jgi:probable F420-dependent oxidoreductase
MKIGLNVPTHGVLARQGRDVFIHKVPSEDLQITKIAQRAEQLGYDSLWFPDHVLMPRVVASSHTANPESGRNAYGDQPNMWDAAVTMGAVAALTNRIKLAPSVLISPYRNPLSDARQFATLDRLSNGRLVMAVGPGWCREEFEAVGISFDERAGRTAECLQIYKLAWTTPWVQFHGRYYDFPEVSIDPKPIQRPRPPIYYGGVTVAGMKRALRYCDGFYPIVTESDVSHERFAQLRDLVHQTAKEIGRDLTDFDLITLVMCRLTEPGNDVRKQRPFLDGSAEEILSDLSKLARYGYSSCTLHLDVRSGTLTEFVEMMERIGEEVVPAAAKIDRG